MALGPQPSGTAGGLTSSTPAPATSTSPSSSSSPSPSVVTSQQIIVTTQVSVSTQMVSTIVAPTPVVSVSSSLVTPASASGVITTSIFFQSSYLTLSLTQAPPGSTAAPVTIVQTVATTEQVTVVPVSQFTSQSVLT